MKIKLKDTLFGAFKVSAISGLALMTSVTFAFADFNWKRFSGQSITVMMPEHPVTDGVRAVLDNFESDTGIDVKLQTMAEDLYFDRMEVALRGSGGNSQMDVYFLPMDSTAYTQHTNGLVHSLQGYLDSRTTRQLITIWQIYLRGFWMRQSTWLMVNGSITEFPPPLRRISYLQIWIM